MGKYQGRKSLPRHSQFVEDAMREARLKADVIRRHPWHPYAKEYPALYPDPLLAKFADRYRSHLFLHARIFQSRRAFTVLMNNLNAFGGLVEETKP